MSNVAMPTHTLNLKLEDDDPWDIDQAIFNVLAQVLEPDSTLSIQEAALQLDALFPSKRPEQGTEKESPESFLLEFWGRIIKTAQQIHYDDPAQDKLLDLVLALKSIDNQELKIWGRSAKLWADLPLLGPELAETWNSFTPEDEASKKRWLGLTAFVARLAKNDSSWVADFPLYVLRDALEGRPRHNHTSQANSDPAADPEIECHVIAALIVLSQCGQHLYETGCADEGGPLGTKSAGPLWEGQEGFSKRWTFWKQRWTEIAVCESLSEDVRRMAREARSMMEAIDKPNEGKAG